MENPGKKSYHTPKIEMIKIDHSDMIVTSYGNGDIGTGRGQGGGCDPSVFHSGARTFSYAPPHSCER